MTVGTSYACQGVRRAVYLTAGEVGGVAGVAGFEYGFGREFWEYTYFGFVPSAAHMVLAGSMAALATRTVRGF